jgi:sulfur-carrier protein
MYALKVRYFAMLREKACCSEELVQTQATTYGELYQELNARYEFGLPLEMVQVAVNDEFIPIQSALITDSQVVFIPPVAGG